MRDLIKKADIFIIAFLAVFIFSAYFLFMLGVSDKSGKTLNVYVDGSLRYSFKLPVYEKKELNIETKYGSNLLIIENSSAYIASADCRGRECVSAGRIEKSGELIICAPHRLTVRIESGKTEGLDAVTY